MQKVGLFFPQTPALKLHKTPFLKITWHISLSDLTEGGQVVLCYSIQEVPFILHTQLEKFCVVRLQSVSLQ